MKKIIKNAAILAMASLVFVACSKKEDDDDSSSSNSKTDLISAHTWKISSYVPDPPYDTLTFNIPACEEDNRYTFSSNGNGSIDNGTLTCDTPETKMESFTWKWMNNETELQIIDDSDTSMLTEVTVSSTTLKGKSDWGFFKVTLTFVKP